MTIEDVMEDIVRQLKEYTERTLAEIITKYDFIVGSKEYLHELMEILPEGANVIYSPFFDIGDPTMIYAIKKFDIRDLLKEENEDEN